jgi:secretion/DNA translocation related CpaE-like protein
MNDDRASHDRSVPRREGSERPWLITDNDGVLDEVLRVAAAAGVDLLHGREPASRATWRSAPLVLIDGASVPAAVAARLPRRPGVVVICAAEPAPQVWEQCVRLGVERTVLLGRDDRVLVDLLSEAATDQPGGGRTIAVIGGCGGAGASVFSCAVAVAAFRAGRSVLLADCDRWGPGLDVLLGIESEPGVRWSDLTAPAGRLVTADLHNALPRLPMSRGSVALLCHDREAAREVPPGTLDVLLDSGRRSGDVTVLDLPRHPGQALDRAAELADLTVLVVPADVWGCFAAGRTHARLAELGATVGLVVRGPSPGGLGAEDLGEALGLPVLASMRPQPRLVRDLEDGRPPGLDPRSPLGRAANVVVRRAGVAGR